MKQKKGDKKRKKKEQGKRWEKQKKKKKTTSHNGLVPKSEFDPPEIVPFEPIFSDKIYGLSWSKFDPEKRKKERETS